MTEIVQPITLDLLDTKPPALSTTSDIPVVETKPDALPAAPETPVEAIEVETPEESAPSEQPDDPSASDKPKAKGVQKRIDELTKQREDERRRAEAAEARLDRALQALENKPKETKEVMDGEDSEPVKPPKTDNAETDEAALEDYISKKATWISRREVKAAIAEQDRKESEKRQQEALRATQETYRSRIEKAVEKYSDYHQIAEAPDVNVSQPVAHAIIHHPQGTDIAYFLGKNREEAKRISDLTVIGPDGNKYPDVAAQLVEVGLIVAKLTAVAPAPVTPATKPIVSAAPKPIKPLESKSTPATKTPDEESMEEYAARVNKELAAEARPGVRH